MSHAETTAGMSKEEIHFRRFMQMGDDFLKIQIYRNAREWYQKALELNMETEQVKQKIADCNEKIQKEKKVIIYIVIIAAIIIGIVAHI
jgi:hypothetical protein